MATKTVDRNFLYGQSVDLFRAAIRSQAIPSYCIWYVKKEVNKA